MLLTSLKLNNFRNYAAEELYWDERVNLLHGLNAQGKSNLLEAICYLGIASSFRGFGEADLIRWGEDYFFLEGRVSTENSGPLVLSAAANRQRQRRWKVNGEAKTRLSDVVGLFHTVSFAPEDIWLVKAGPEARRKYLNQQMSQLDREYCRTLISYNRVLRQRNACLRSWDSLADSKAQLQQAEQLSLWDEQLVSLGAPVALCRERVVSRLAPLAAQVHRSLSRGEELSLSYVNSFAKNESCKDKTGAEQAFRQELARVARSEQLRGLSLAGPHRDELAISLNGRPAREFASQGQQRTAALSLKLAELELARQLRGYYPVLLLDDVLSELDQHRRKEILSLVVGKTQTFISAVSGDLPSIAGKKWKIEAGRVIK